jgi:hypothetical protein
MQRIEEQILVFLPLLKDSSSSQSESLRDSISLYYSRQIDVKFGRMGDPFCMDRKANGESAFAASRVARADNKSS